MQCNLRSASNGAARTTPIVRMLKRQRKEREALSFIKYAAFGFFGVVCFALGLIVREMLSDHKSAPRNGLFAVEAAGEAKDFKLHSDARGWITEALPEQFPGHGLSHLVSLEPGATRGNHAHPDKAEVLLVFGGSAIVRVRCPGRLETPSEFRAGDIATDGTGLKRFVLPAGCAHAVRNAGEHTMYLLSYTDRPSKPYDTVRGGVNQLFSD